MKICYALVICISLLGWSNVYSQKECDLESYYNNPDLFHMDSVYNNVWIDGQQFTIKVLSDRMNEYLEIYDEEQVEQWNDGFKTLLFYDQQTQKMVYAKKFSFAIPEFEKVSGDLSKEGKLYLRWFSSGGGSGYLLETSLVYLDHGRITMEELFTTDELDFLIQAKNDQEIYILRGIWDMTEDEETGDFESHFADHKYEIVFCRFGENGFESQSLGTTTKKYASLDEGKTAFEIFAEIKRNEKLLPPDLKLNDFVDR